MTEYAFSLQKIAPSATAGLGDLPPTGILLPQQSQQLQRTLCHCNNITSKTLSQPMQRQQSQPMQRQQQMQCNLACWLLHCWRAYVTRTWDIELTRAQPRSTLELLRHLVGTRRTNKPEENEREHKPSEENEREHKPSAHQSLLSQVERMN